MGRKVLKFELNGKIIFSKPFQTNDNLSYLRENIKERVKCSFKFLDQDSNQVDLNDENDFIIEDILDGQIIKLKSIEDINPNELELNIFLNDKKINCISLDKGMQLSQSRKLINKEIKEKFNFLDIKGNDIEEIEEKDFIIDDILNNGNIKLKEISIKSPVPKFIPKYDFSKYEVLEKEDNFTLYKYSNKERQSNKNLVYQYFYDEYNINDYDNAYIMLFFGKVGDGKTTAINALFNIIKGIKLEDNYRFILITESKIQKGCYNINNGIHIYYLKDYNNKPITIIDCLGYGDTRGIKYDEEIDEAFKYVFSNIINHINTICFISKSSNNRLDRLTRYIFSCIISLLSKEINENLIFLSTFAYKEIIRNGPNFIDDIIKDSDFSKIIKRIGGKWWFAFDSKSILENDIDKVTKYSFSQLNEFYEEKVKKLCPKSTKKCVEILEARNQLTIQVYLLIDYFRNLFILKKNEKTLNGIKIKNEIKEEINNARNQIILIIMKLKYISQKLEDITINNNNLNAKYDIINIYINQAEELGEYNGELKKDLKEMEKNIKIIREINNLKEEEILNLNDSQLIEKLGIINSL